MPHRAPPWWLTGRGWVHSTFSWDGMYRALNELALQLRGVPDGFAPGGGGGAGGELVAETMLPGDAQVLGAVLQLLQRVARGSYVVRTTLAARWPWIPVLLSMLASGLPYTFKASVLDTLGAFASATPTLANDVWRGLEEYQVLQTAPRAAGASGPVADIRTDMVQVEALAETYPETAAFLRLLTTLVETTGVPADLGRGVRDPPGLQPYLAYAVDSVCLRLRQLRFGQPGERWTLYATVTRFFLVTAAAIPAASTPAADLVRHPGTSLLHHLLATADLRNEVRVCLRAGASSACVSVQ
jgi:hypothetical protein